ncbi:MAG: hypothetical protein R3190_10875, partial [Thermoanaerobaculia bacterium]|nr:hypothetical protein [Thermoanaerobaculia bacterium]
MRSRRSQQGHALVMALVVLLIASVATALLAQALDTRQRVQRDALLRVRLDLMADAAVAEDAELRAAAEDLLASDDADLPAA